MIRRAEITKAMGKRGTEETGKRIAGPPMRKRTNETQDAERGEDHAQTYGPADGAVGVDTVVHRLFGRELSLLTGGEQPYSAHLRLHLQRQRRARGNPSLRRPTH